MTMFRVCYSRPLLGIEDLNRLAGPPSARSEMAEVLLLAAAVSLFPVAQLRHSTPDLLLSGVPPLLLLGAGLHPPRGVSNSDLKKRYFIIKSAGIWRSKEGPGSNLVLAHTGDSSLSYGLRSIR
jgi:hypothetical protein